MGAAEAIASREPLTLHAAYLHSRQPADARIALWSDTGIEGVAAALPADLAARAAPVQAQLLIPSEESSLRPLLVSVNGDFFHMSGSRLPLGPIAWGGHYVLMPPSHLPVLAIGSGRTFGLPNPALIFIALLLIAWFVLRHTTFGRSVYAVGSNDEAARLSGVSVRRVRTLVYVISGLMAGVAGLLYASQLGVGTPIAGEAFELDAIAATVVGGTSLFGGQGSIGGTFMGAALLGILAVNGFAERLDDGAKVGKLLAQEVRHRPPFRLVLRRDLGAVHRPRVPRDRDSPRRVVGEELEEHVGEAEPRDKALIRNLPHIINGWEAYGKIAPPNVPTEENVKNAIDTLDIVLTQLDEDFNTNDEEINLYLTALRSYLHHARAKAIGEYGEREYEQDYQKEPGEGRRQRINDYDTAISILGEALRRHISEEEFDLIEEATSPTNEVVFSGEPKYTRYKRLYIDLKRERSRIAQ